MSISLPTHTVSASSAVATTVTAAVASAQSGSISVELSAYYAISCVMLVIGIGLARLVTIVDENKRSGRRQPARETLPLTGIAILIGCPLVYHFQIPVPWAAPIGLGIGYSVRTLLAIFGRGTVSAAKAFFKEMNEGLKDGTAPGPTHVDPELPEDMKRIIDRADEV